MNSKENNSLKINFELNHKINLINKLKIKIHFIKFILSFNFFKDKLFIFMNLTCTNQIKSFFN
jgi:hypothetical protein